MKKNLLRILTSFILLALPTVIFAQLAPNLGSASSFALTTSAGAFTNSGNTVITGNIGTTTGPVTGFPPGIVNGTIHNMDAAATTAGIDLCAAYSDLAARTCDRVISSTLGGQTLTPGVSCSGAASSIAANGVVTLDAGGNPNAIFIIKINGALSTGTYTNINLINGATASNVFWQVNGAFTLGDFSVFRGTVITQGAIELLEASSLIGRGLACVGAITLHNNSVLIPGCGITSYFRTRATGNWNDINTWECSPDNINWFPATVTPDFTSNTITIRTPHTVTITVNLTTDQTTIISGGAVVLNPNVVLTINDGMGVDFTIASGGALRILSTATGTGMIGTSTGTVSGNAIVQRFISSASARSAWRLLTAPVRSTTGVNGTIFNNWQSGGISIPGIATTVTGPNYNGSGLPGTPVPDANGLDYHTPLPSMQWWDVVDQTLQPVTVTNNPAINPLFTTAPTAANRSYYIFINGDRFAYSGRPNTTILPAVGELQMGDQVFTLSSTANAFNLVGNPYASPVDLNLLRLDNTANNVNSTYYYWDPYLTGAYGVGGYVTVSYDGMGNETITPSGADRTRFLQSGQAMFVQTNTSGASSLVFKETQKSTTNVNNIFRTATGQIENIRVDLKVINGGNSALVDGIVTGFDISYAAAIDRYDAVKFYNIGESIAFMRDGKSLSIERRPLIKSEDILFLNLVNLQAGKGYQFEINPSLNITGLTAYLVDNYLKTTTPIDLNKATTVNFMVTGDAASTGANRFSIAFAKPAIVQAVKPGISVYPNPVTNGIINLQMNNMPQGIYTVRIFNSLGQTMLTRQINHTSGSRTETLRLGKGVKGVYNIEVIKPDNSKFSNKVMAN